jgi:hypothetical protein
VCVCVCVCVCAYVFSNSKNALINSEERTAIMFSTVTQVQTAMVAGEVCCHCLYSLTL